MQSNKPFVVIPTVDVEAAHGSDPFNQMILGTCLDGSKWGVFKIAEAFYTRGISGTFFVDVYEDVLWGEKKMKSLCQSLIEMKQDVQLHTHPSWRVDPRDDEWLNNFKGKNSRLPQHKDLMAKLTFDEQYDLVIEGISLLEKWIGKKPIAHRSGGYSINQDTILALTNANIKIDSSMNVAHKNSEVNWTINKVKERDNLFEFPVTVYDLTLQLLGKKIWTKKMKTDIDSAPLEHLIEYVAAARSNQVTTMNLFMHSYSLLEYDTKFREFKASEQTYNKLNNFLDFLQDNNVPVLSISEIYSDKHLLKKLLKGKDYSPPVQDNKLIYQLAKAKLFRTLVGL